MLPLNHHDPMDVFDMLFARSDEDSIIALGSRRKDSKGGEPPHYLYPLRVRDRDEMLPTLFDYCIQETQYVMPNTLDAAALYGKAEETYRAGLESGKPEYFAAKNQFVKELCALYVDLDVGRDLHDIPPGHALGAVLQMTLDMQMVTPSFAALSGRGVYLLWLLRDENTIRPPANTPDNRQCWKLIEHEICTRLQGLKADPRALRLAQWLKRPGTIDSRTQSEVKYMTFGVNRLRDVPIYTLPELMDFFELHHTARVIDLAPAQKQIAGPGLVVPPKREPVRKVQAGKGSEPWRKRCDEIERLAQHRRGMPEGVRLVTLFHYHQAMEKYLAAVYRDEPGRGSRAHEEATAATLGLNKTFRPPLAESEVLAKVCHRHLGKGKLARNDTVALDLAVTETEARVLGLECLIPGRLKAELDARDMKLKAKARQVRERRRVEVDELIASGLRDRDVIAEMQRRYPLGQIAVSRAFVSARRKEALKQNPPWAFEGYIDPPPVTPE